MLRCFAFFSAHSQAKVVRDDVHVVMRQQNRKRRHRKAPKPVRRALRQTRRQKRQETRKTTMKWLLMKSKRRRKKNYVTVNCESIVYKRMSAKYVEKTFNCLYLSFNSYFFSFKFVFNIYMNWLTNGRASSRLQTKRILASKNWIAFNERHWAIQRI